MLPFQINPFDPDAPGRSLRVRSLDLLLGMGVVLAVALIAGSAASLHLKADESDSATGCRFHAG
jgi:hypothetical protein